MSEKIEFVSHIFLIAIIGLLQSLSLIAFNGIKPNLVLVFLVVSIFSVKNLWQYAVLILISLFFLSYGILSKELAIFAGIMFLAYYFKGLLSEHAFFSVLLLIGILTFAFYIISDPSFIFAHFGVFMKELFFNAIAGLVFGFLLKNPF